MKDDVVWDPDSDPRRQPQPEPDSPALTPKDFLTKDVYEKKSKADLDLKALVNELNKLTQAAQVAQGKFQFMTGSWEGFLTANKPLPEVLEVDDNHFRVHSPDQCEGTYCAIHNSSNHFMRRWPRSIWALRVWRTCPHGIRHPDPDDVAYWVRRGKKKAALQEHECDQCCTPPEALP